MILKIIQLILKKAHLSHLTHSPRTISSENLLQVLAKNERFQQKKFVSKKTLSNPSGAIIIFGLLLVWIESGYVGNVGKDGYHLEEGFLDARRRNLVQMAKCVCMRTWMYLHMCGHAFHHHFFIT